MKNSTLQILVDLQYSAPCVMQCHTNSKMMLGYEYHMNNHLNVKTMLYTQLIWPGVDCCHVGGIVKKLITECYVLVVLEYY